MTSIPCLIMQYKPYVVELPHTKEADFIVIALLVLYICIHLINNNYCGITHYAHRTSQTLVSSVSAIACTLK